MARGGILVASIMMITVGGTMLGIGIYLTGTLFGALNITGNSIFYDTNTGYTQSGLAVNNAETNVFLAFQIMGIALIVGGFSAIIAILLGMVGE